MKSGSDVVAYYYQEKFHCVFCARKRLGKKLGLPKPSINGEEVVKITRSYDDLKDIFCEDCAEEINGE